MNDNKKKTRHDLLRELESIKGLLGENSGKEEQRKEEDIPVLQEIFAPEPEATDATKVAPPESLKREELAALKSAYQSLLADAELFADSETGDARNEQSAPPAKARNTPAAPSKTTSPASKALPGQQPLFGAGSDRERQQALLSSYGENPFLPQHIRARLRGNRPDPSEPQSDKAPGDKPPPEKTPTPSRETLINELMQQVMPQLEQRLREQLQRMSAEEIKAMLKEK